MNAKFFKTGLAVLIGVFLTFGMQGYSFADNYFEEYMDSVVGVGGQFLSDEVEFEDVSADFPQPVGLPDGDGGVIGIYVNWWLYFNYISTSLSLHEPLEEYISDLKEQNYEVKVFAAGGGTPRALQNRIENFASDPDAVGVVLIGDLPVPWFATDVSGEWQKYPCDLFYMDYDGMWSPWSGDPYFFAYSGHGEYSPPDIWVARIPLKSNLYTQAQQLAYYLDKVHEYKKEGTINGQAIPSNRGLTFFDDLWFNEPSKLSTLYSQIDKNTLSQATKNNYNSMLSGDYRFVHLKTGGRFHYKKTDPLPHTAAAVGDYHVFLTGSGTDESDALYDFSDVDQGSRKQPLFYQLDAPRSCNYVVPNFIGGSYLISPNSNGLVVVGPTSLLDETGYEYDHKLMLDHYFYENLDNGMSFGQAYKEWIDSIVQEKGDASHQRFYHGLTLLGDPTLGIHPPIASIDSITPSAAEQGQQVTFQGSGSVTNGSITAYEWRSDLDGQLSDNSSFNISSLSLGEHKIYLRVRDNLFRWSTEDEKTLMIGDDIQGPVMVFMPMRKENNNLIGIPEGYPFTRDDTIYLAIEDIGGGEVDEAACQFFYQTPSGENIELTYNANADPSDFTSYEFYFEDYCGINPCVRLAALKFPAETLLDIGEYKLYYNLVDNHGNHAPNWYDPEPPIFIVGPSDTGVEGAVRLRITAPAWYIPAVNNQIDLLGRAQSPFTSDEGPIMYVEIDWGDGDITHEYNPDPGSQEFEFHAIHNYAQNNTGYLVKVKAVNEHGHSKERMIIAQTNISNNDLEVHIIEPPEIGQGQAQFQLEYDAHGYSIYGWTQCWDIEKYSRSGTLIEQYYDCSFPPMPPTFEFPYVDSWNYKFNLFFYLVDTQGRISVRAQSQDYYLDNKEPTGTIVIESDQVYTPNHAVTLQLTGNDVLSGVTHMMLRNEDSSYGDPENYATTKQWTLSNGDGEKTVYVKFQDAAGNWSQEYSDSILCGADIYPPEFTAGPLYGASPTDSQPLANGVVFDENDIIIWAHSDIGGGVNQDVSYWKAINASTAQEIVFDAGDISYFDDDTAVIDPFESVLDIGVYNVIYHIEDYAGNVLTNVANPYTIHIDRGGPTFWGPYYDYWMNVDGGTFKQDEWIYWKASDPSGISNEYVVYIDHNGVEKRPYVARDSCYYWPLTDMSCAQIETSKLKSQDYQLWICAEDNGGNESCVSPAPVMTVDNPPPEITSAIMKRYGGDEIDLMPLAEDEEITGITMYDHFIWVSADAWPLPEDGPWWTHDLGVEKAFYSYKGCYESEYQWRPFVELPYSDDIGHYKGRYHRWSWIYPKRLLPAGTGCYDIALVAQDACSENKTILRRRIRITSYP